MAAMIDFLPEDYSWQRARKKTQRRRRRGLLLFLVLTGAGAFAQSRQQADLKIQLEKARDLRSQTEQSIGDSDALFEKLSSLQRRASLVETIATPDASVDVINAVVQARPQSVVLQRIQMRRFRTTGAVGRRTDVSDAEHSTQPSANESALVFRSLRPSDIIVDGFARDQHALVRFMTALRSSQSVRDVALLDATSSAEQTRAGEHHFQLRLVARQEPKRELQSSSFRSVEHFCLMPESNAVLRRL